MCQNADWAALPPPLDLHFDTPSSTYIGNDCVLVGVQLLPFFLFFVGDVNKNL